MSDPIRIVICATGSGSHVLAGLLSAKPTTDVRVLTRSAEKAARWTEIMQNEQLVITVQNGEDEQLLVESNRFMVTDEPEKAARECDMVIFALPAFGHSKYLTLLKPYLEEGCVIVGLPGESGFEFDLKDALADRLADLVVINFESLPWICRMLDFGRSAKIFGTKSKLVGAMQGDLSKARIAEPLATLQELLGIEPKLIVSGHLLAITLMSVNAYIHTGIMCGRWKNWDGKALNDPPLFYKGIDEQTALYLSKTSEEVVMISRRIMAENPQVDLSLVTSLYDWYISHYENDIKDKTNLMSAIRTNLGYKGLTHPMIETEEGKYLPNFNQRFLLEDVPFGLLVIRGIAEIVGIATPWIDSVLNWCQEIMGKEYLVGEKLIGKDLQTTRCPQRYGFRTVDDILF